MCEFVSFISYPHTAPEVRPQMEIYTGSHLRKDALHFLIPRYQRWRVIGLGVLCDKAG